jgi:DNA anti-recombination protein RmuC
VPESCAPRTCTLNAWKTQVGQKSQDCLAQASSVSGQADSTEPCGVCMPTSSNQQTQQPGAALRAEARSQYLEELRSLEDNYRRKLQNRKASLERAEEELLEADRQARIQLVEQRKRHQAEMRSLTESSREELERRRAELAEENTAAIARWQAQLQAELEEKLATMRAAMTRHLEEAKAKHEAEICAQVALHSSMMQNFAFFGCIPVCPGQELILLVHHACNNYTMHTGPGTWSSRGGRSKRCGAHQLLSINVYPCQVRP